eukprot:1149900-Pelagomonas_calceolata.AAC.2
MKLSEHIEMQQICSTDLFNGQDNNKIQIHRGWRVLTRYGKKQLCMSGLAVCIRRGSLTSPAAS